MQTIPALGAQAVAAQFGEAGDAPHVGGEPQSFSSISAAASTSRSIVPAPSSCTALFFCAFAARNLYMPLRMPSPASSGIGGCA